MSRTIVSRRDFLKGLTALGLAAPSVLAGCANFRGLGGEGDTIRIAGLNSLSGTFTESGQETEKGNLLAIEAAGEVLGRKLEFVSLDTGGNVDKGIRVTKEALSDGIRFFEGISLSSVALAVSDEINRRDGVLLTAVGADEVTGKDCKKSTFRWSVPTYGAIRETVTPMLRADSSLKRWYAITPNYVFGESLLRNAEQVLKEHDAELVGNDLHSLEETEFSNYISNAMAANPDVLLLLNFGAQSSQALRQAVEFGVKGNAQILIPWSAGLTQFRGLGSDIIDGVYFGAQYWHTIDEPGNRKLVELAQAKYESPPSYPLAAGYIGVKLIIDAIEEAQSTDPDDVIYALEGHEYEGPTGLEHIRVDDHQVVKDYYLLRGKPKDKMKDEHDFVDVVSQGDTALPLEQSECKLD